jgi:hypothetical protein
MAHYSGQNFEIRDIITSKMARTSKKARRTSPLNLPTAFDLFTPSKEIVLKNIWIFGPLYAVPLIFGIHSWIWAPHPGKTSHHWWTHAYGFGNSQPGSPFPDYSSLLIGFSIFWLVFVIITGTVASIMSQAAQLDAVEHRRLDYQILWRTCRELGLRLFGLYVVTLLFIVAGLFCFIVPGLIFLRRYFLAPYVMLDKKVSIREAMEESSALTKLNSGSIWGIIGVIILISLLGVIPFVGGIISFIVGCLYSVAPAIRYHQLRQLRRVTQV